jgi:imidazolonepropionase-like amidohydrolase
MLLTLAMTGVLSWAAPAGARDVVIHAGTLLDGTTAAPRSHVSVMIHDDKIVDIKDGFVEQHGAEVVDLSSSTLMPGFIDCHVHIAALLPAKTNATEYELTHSDIDRAFDGALFSRQMLQQGFTSARDVGGGDDTVSVKNAIEAGKISGPRLWVSLEPLSPTAGHGDYHNGLDPALSHPGWDNGLVDSTDEARLKVRQHKRRGATVIKVIPSGGIASTGDDPNRQLMTNEEMRAVVETAHGLGLKVAAHIYPASTIENAVRAGVDSIEHGSFATAQTFELMKAHGTFLVPTLTVYEVFYTAAHDHPELLTPGTPEKELQYDPLPKKNLPLALKSGVKIAYGTDLGQGDHTQEFALLIANGMTPAQALITATRSSAELLGASDLLGTVQPGHYADLVATDGNPLQQPELFRHVSFVMKGGLIYRRSGTEVLPQGH